MFFHYKAVLEHFLKIHIYINTCINKRVELINSSFFEVGKKTLKITTLRCIVRRNKPSKNSDKQM